jgi:nitrate reductase beta subunit
VEVALPLHPEFRTLPMVFYVPPLSPVRAVATSAAGAPLAGASEQRIPVRYLAAMFAAGNADVVSSALRRLVAVRTRRRAATVGDVSTAAAEEALREAGLTPEVADAIHRLTVYPTIRERAVRPPGGREAETEQLVELQGAAGLRARVP